MKTQITLILFTLLIGIIGCKKEAITTDNPNIAKKDTNTYLSNSFLPMNIGNYWIFNNDNYIEITDTIRINGNLFYKFSSLTGGDAMGIRYLRIDDDNNLIEKFPDNPNWTYTHAKFNSKAGNKFYTLNDKTVNDYEVTVIYNSTDTIKFEFERIYHSVSHGDKHIEAYKKGLGFIDNWKEIRINDRIYRY